MKKKINPLGGHKCWVCGAEYGLERHEIYFGQKNRDVSLKYGMVVMLCFHHHRDNREGVHGYGDLDYRLKRWGQKQFKRMHPDLDFLQVFGRNYLE